MDQTKAKLSDTSEQVRAERDRFVALAFSRADLLFELDANKIIVFAGGVTEPLLGWRGDDFAVDQVSRMREQGLEAQVTMVAMPNIAELNKRLDPAATENLGRTLGACLRTNSVGGDTAPQIGDGKFSLVHDASLNLVAKSGFNVAFHPIIDSHTGHIHHYEALARFHSDIDDEFPYRQFASPKKRAPWAGGGR